MSYSHFGKIGDVWKHIPLCNFLINEKPRNYIESNAAYAKYSLSNTSEQQYGFYTVLEYKSKLKEIAELPFIKIYDELEKAHLNTIYLGSPGLAMTILKNQINSYYFFDLDKKALENIVEFANQNQINHQVNTINKDSIEGVYEMLPNLSFEDFIFFDPYFVWEKNSLDHNIFEVFLKATLKGIKCILWYGFHTLQHKRLMKEYMDRDILKYKVDKTKNKIHCIELYLKSISENEPEYNPGVMDVGLIISNLSDKSIKEFHTISDLIVQIYSGKMIRNVNGELIKDIIY